jgi:imidazolonepropionase-like amidohydrolase
LSEDSYRKVFDVLDAGLQALALADRAGIPIAFGTDLLGPMHNEQSREFALRAQVQSAPAIVRSATSVGAQLLNLQGQIGIVAPGAFADLLVVDGNPLEDIRNTRRVRWVVSGGRVFDAAPLWQSVGFKP